MPIPKVVNVIKNKLHEFLNAHDLIESTKIFLIRDKNSATNMFVQKKNNNVTAILNFLKFCQKDIMDCALLL